MSYNDDFTQHITASSVSESKAVHYQLDSEVTSNYKPISDPPNRTPTTKAIFDASNSVANEIFQLCKVQFQWTSQLISMAVSNNIMVMGFSNNHIFRIDLAKPQFVEGFHEAFIFDS